MAEMPKPRLAIYAALAIAVLLIGSRFLRGSSQDAGGAGSAAVTQTTGSAGAGSGGGAGGGSASAGGAGSRGSAPDGAGAGGGGAGGGGAPDGLSASVGEAGPGGQLIVDVKGAVRRPGVYRLATGARALDAVRHAGGMTGRADRLGVNLAARVTDGGEVVVPARGPGSGRGRSTAGGSTGTDGAPGVSGAAGAGRAGAGVAAGPISLDLNTATAQQLEHVGPATAAKIVAYREQHGGIRSVDELDAVSGIGEKRLAAIRAQLEP
jgi:competence protein ComEA